MRSETRHVTALDATERSAARRHAWITRGLLGAPLVWLGLFFLIPVLLVGLESIGAVHALPRETGGVSLDAWSRFLFGDSLHLRLFWKSIRVSLTVSAIVVILAYPLGYFLALGAGKRKYVLLLLIIAPFLTSFLLRVLAWTVILGDKGVINSFLVWVGARPPDQPIAWLLYSQFTVILVLIYVWVPFVALPIFVSLNDVDRSYLEASNDLGASRWRTFVRVTFPLSLRGVIAGFVFVFVPTIGEFVTPQLVGGTRGYLFGNAINDRFTSSLDWRTGSVLAFFLLAVVALLMAVAGRYLRPKELVR